MIFLDIIKQGQLLQDDWSIAENSYYSKSFLSRLDTYLNGFITRPFGALWLSVISIFEYDFNKYFFTNITIYYMSNILIYKIFENKYNNSIALIIFILLLFPNLSSTNIFSPAAQSLGVVSLFFWSISFYLIYFGTKQNNKNKNFFSWIFFIISVLTYEVSFVLIIFNLFFNNQKLKKIFSFLFHFKMNKLLNFKEIKIFFFVVFFIIFYQLVIIKFLNFEASNRYRILNLETLEYIYKFAHIPFTLIYDTLLIFFKSITNITKDFKNLFFIFLIIALLIKILKSENLKSSKKNIFLLTLISYFLFIFFFVVASSLPTIYGYYNRAMGAYNFIVSITIVFLLVNLPIKNLLKKALIILLIFLNLNNFVNQIKSNLIASNLRNDLIDQIVSKINVTDKEKIYVFSLFPTFNNYLNFQQLIFSEESYDFNKAILYKSNKLIGGYRIYKKIECNKKYSLKEKDNFITFYNPSKSKKNNELEKITIKKKENNIYLFYNFNNNRLYNLSSIEKITKLENFISCN